VLVAVDDDVDPQDPAAVNWAIVNRCQPHRDMRIIHPRPLPFNPVRNVADGKRYDTVDSALLVDATAKAPFPPVSLPAQEHIEHALALWQELELSALALRAPWYGYSLGMWSPEHRAEAG
jgi:3-polyprenyl-4-hydroxybenzoate decarboxylase